MVLTHTIVQSNPDGYDTSLEITVRVDQDFDVDHIISIKAWSNKTLSYTDITHCMVEHFPAQVDDMLEKIEWRQIYMESRDENPMVEERQFQNLKNITI